MRSVEWSPAAAAAVGRSEHERGRGGGGGRGEPGALVGGAGRVTGACEFARLKANHEGNWEI